MRYKFQLLLCSINVVDSSQDKQMNVTSALFKLFNGKPTVDVTTASNRVLSFKLNSKET